MTATQPLTIAEQRFGDTIRTAPLHVALKESESIGGVLEKLSGKLGFAFLEINVSTLSHLDLPTLRELLQPVAALGTAPLVLLSHVDDATPDVYRFLAEVSTEQALFGVLDLAPAALVVYHSQVDWEMVTAQFEKIDRSLFNLSDPTLQKHGKYRFRR